MKNVYLRRFLVALRLALAALKPLEKVDDFRRLPPPPYPGFGGGFCPTVLPTEPLHFIIQSFLQVSGSFDALDNILPILYYTITFYSKMHPSFSGQRIR